MNNFIGLLFLSRDVAHREHLATDSYAKHMALGDFYSEVIGLADSLAEMWQGREGKVLQVEFVEEESAGSIVETLQAHLEMIEKLRYKVVDKEDTALQNVIDEIVGVYLTTLYKLRRFK